MRGDVACGGSSGRTTTDLEEARNSGDKMKRFVLTEPQSRLIGKGSSAPRCLTCLATACADQSEIPPSQSLSQSERRKRGDEEKKNARSPSSAPPLSFPFPIVTSQAQYPSANRNIHQPIAAPLLPWLFYKTTRVGQPIAKIHQWENPGSKYYHDGHLS